jgi:diguanylate cyclase
MAQDLATMHNVARGVWLSRLAVVSMLALIIALVLATASVAYAQVQTRTPSDADSAALALDDASGRIAAWPKVRTLSDPESKLNVQAAIAAIPQFQVPTTAYATLGIKPEAVWLHIPVSVSPFSNGEWLLDIDYALLNHIDVYVTQYGAVLQKVTTGNDIAYHSRPVVSRTPVVELNLSPGQQYDVLVRVETIGARILPISFSKFSAYHNAAINEQMLQGVLTSLALGLMIYSFLQWLSLREALYIKYGMLVFFSMMFSVHFFGIGEQYLWTDIDWIEKRLAGFTSLMAAASTALFVEDVLAGDMHRRLRTAIRTIAGVLFAAALLHAADIISITTVGYLMTTIGVVPSLLGVPGAIARMRRRDWVGLYFFIAWVGYFIASAIMVGMVRGKIDANLWTLHAFQIGATLDMLIFLRIAVLRSAAVHIEAERAARERDSLISLAQTDALTGVLNRRGLYDVLNLHLRGATRERIVAVYVMDLDEFKPVNDQHGHDIGDALLVQVANRLKGSVRAGDSIARLGGDEFVVVANGVHNVSQAQELGSKLVMALRAPFALGGDKDRGTVICQIGVTIGYALAPLHGLDAIPLLKIADAAMYQGKQRGRNCVVMAAANT